MAEVGCKYIVPLTYKTEDNLTRVNKKTVKFINCSSEFDPNELCGLWNFNKCPNDDNYCTPFVDGDKLYFQFAYSSRIIKKIIPALYDTSTGLIIEPVVDMATVQHGQNPENEKDYYNLVIDTSKIVVDCFFIKLNFYNCDLDTNSEYLTCVSDRQGEGYSLYQSRLICYDALCETKEVVYSDLFCRARCNDKTILLTGEYTKFDCDGQYYGDFPVGVVNIFKPQIRVYGEVTPIGFSFDEVLVNNVRRSSQQKENYTLYTKKLPYFIVKMIAKVFNSQSTTIDGVQYKGTVNLSKNFEEGSMWIIKETIYRLCDEIDFTCK